MTNPTVLRSSLVPILVSASLLLQKKLGLDPSRIKIVARPGGEVPKADGDQDLVLRFRGWRTDKDHESRHDFRVYRKLEILLRTRIELDETGLDVDWLTSTEGEGVPSGGIVYEEDLVDALQGAFLYDPLGNQLVLQSLACLQGGDYDRSKRVSSTPGWGEVSIEIEVLINMPLTLNELGY